MLPWQITKMDLATFRERSRGKKVVLLYPWLSYRNVFLAQLLNHTQNNLLYYRVAQDDCPLSNFVAGLRAEITDPRDNPLPEPPQRYDVQELAMLLAGELNAIKEKTGCHLLVLDELDRLYWNAEARMFFKLLVEQLTAGIQLALNSRMLTYEPWGQIVASGDAAVIGTAHRGSDLIFTPLDDPKPQLDIYAFGRGHAYVNGHAINNWDGALPRNLFFYFIDHDLVTRDQIFAIFWDKLSVKEATNVFHVTKRKITERISSKVNDDDSYELTQYAAGFYRPSDKVMRHYDVADFEAAVEAARSTLDDAKQRQLYERAIAIYTAPYLETLDMPWVNERRDRLQRMLVDALTALGRLSKRQDKPEHALGYFIRALKYNAAREDIHRDVMELYITLERRTDAVQQYHMLVQQLQHAFGIPPSQETQAIYERIQADG